MSKLYRHSPNYIIFLLLIVVICFTRIRYLDVPLERDEGEYAYAGQMILKGYTPYGEVYNMKFPGTYLMYAITMFFFGQNVIGIHLGLLLVNLITAMFIYRIADNLFDRLSGFIAATTFIVLSSGPEVYGMFANAEHFVLLYAIPGIWFLLKGLKEKRNILFFLAGILLGLSVLMKQHGVLFAMFGGLYLLWVLWKLKVSFSEMLKKSGWYIIGLFFPFILMTTWLASRGVLERFWWLTFEYAQSYVSLQSWSESWHDFKVHIFRTCHRSIVIWLMAFAGLAASIIFQKKSAFFILFFITSFIAVSIGFYFRPHYWILLLPLIALLFTFTLYLIRGLNFNYRRYYLATIIFLVSTSSFLYFHKGYYFHYTSKEMNVDVHGYSNFLETQKVGEYIRRNTNEGDQIAIIGHEPEILFYAQRKSATGYLYMYPLLEDHPYADRMINEFIQEIELGKPKYLIASTDIYTWNGRQESIDRLQKWYYQFQREHYDVELVMKTNWKTLQVERFANVNTSDFKSISIILRRKANE